MVHHTHNVQDGLGRCRHERNVRGMAASCIAGAPTSPAQGAKPCTMPGGMAARPCCAYFQRLSAAPTRMIGGQEYQELKLRH